MCSPCGCFPLEVLDTAVSTVSFVAVADFGLLDTAILAPRSFVAVVDATVSALSALQHTHEGAFRCSRGDGIGYDFEYMRAAALHFPTVNTGYWDTLGSRTFSTVSVQIILHYRRLRRPVFL